MTSTLFRREFRTALLVSSCASFGAGTFVSNTDTTSELILRAAEPLERALNKAGLPEAEQRLMVLTRNAAVDSASNAAMEASRQTMLVDAKENRVVY
eukprot:EC848984.1.p2 GENE.EC848984.1~~EC848984.1.p2  ORF type:complete len:97 (+),score=23.31 EC848984.1:104-394(+)